MFSMSLPAVGEKLLPDPLSNRIRSEPVRMSKGLAAGSTFSPVTPINSRKAFRFLRRHVGAKQIGREDEVPVAQDRDLEITLLERMGIFSGPQPNRPGRGGGEPRPLR